MSDKSHRIIVVVAIRKYLYLPSECRTVELKFIIINRNFIEKVHKNDCHNNM